MKKLAFGIPAALLFLLLSIFSGSAGQIERPNIIFILADDLDDEVFSHAGKIKALLTDKGIRFDRHFVSLSLCCPSRTTILRGQYAHNTGVYGNQPPAGGFDKVYESRLENSTVATWLQGAGYRTALFGKYLNGYPNAAAGSTYIPPGWDYWASPNGGEPYLEYGYTLNENGTPVAYGKTDADYLVDVLARKSAAFLRDTTARFPDRPFFMYVAPYIPHGPATPPSRYAGSEPDLTVPRTASFNEPDIGDKPVWVRGKPLLTDAEMEKMDGLYRMRRQSFRAVEDLVQNLIETLAAVGQLDRTYLFFTSDNGFHQGQHRLNSGKNSAFEEDLKVPLVVRGPGVPAGATVDALTANVDFAPTWTEIARVTPSGFVDGRSLVPFLAGKSPPAWRRVLLLEHGGARPTASRFGGLFEPPDPHDHQAASTGGIPAFTGLRTAEKAIGNRGPMTYIEYDSGEGELYDLLVDPLELQNLFSTADPGLKTGLSAWLGRLRTASGATLRRREEDLAGF